MQRQNPVDIDIRILASCDPSSSDANRARTEVVSVTCECSASIDFTALLLHGLQFCLLEQHATERDAARR